MNKQYFNKNFFKLKKSANEIDILLRGYGIGEEEHFKIIKKISFEILKNRPEIFSFLQEKSTASFKDFSNSDLILITLLTNHLKQAKRDVAAIASLENEKEIASILAKQTCPTIKKLLKEKKVDAIKDISKLLSKIKVEVAIVVKPKRDSERILKIKLIIEILNSIIQYEKQFIKSGTLVATVKAFEDEYYNYCELTDVSVLLDFKNFDASRWDKILVANIHNIRSLVIFIKKDNNNVEQSNLHDKTVIVAINTLNNLHDLLSELKKIKDVDIHRKYFKEKFMKIVGPIAKIYSTSIDWGGVIEILRITGWNDLLYLIPRKIRKQYKAK